MFVYSNKDIEKKIDEFDRLWAKAASEMSWCIGGSRPPKFDVIKEACEKAISLYNEIEKYFKEKGMEVPEHIKYTYKLVKDLHYYASMRKCMR